jgi:4-aminobutyrate aminotransferase-like enzyme
VSENKQILSLNRFDGAITRKIEPALAELISRREASFGASSVLFYEKPIRIARGDGVYLFDVNGKRFLDVYNNVSSVGHCHPHVVAAISRQAAQLNINSRYLVHVVEDYAERLLGSFPAPLSNLVMTCTGSESNDLALRIAQAVTNSRGFIVTACAYHGNTAAVTAISPSSFKTQKLASHVRTVPAPDPRVTPGRDISIWFAHQIQAAINELRDAGYGFAGLVVDSIFSSDGIFVDPPGFLATAAKTVREAGGLFIADEVQSGFGRTGAGLWGFGRHGVVPDIVTMGKPMGNGFPMGGVVTKPEYLACFCAETGYFNTFGGNPVAAAAGAAVLDVLTSEGLIENAKRQGAALRAGLDELRGMFPEISEVRGAGLFIGLDIIDPTSGGPDPAQTSRIINAMKERGILIGAAGMYGHTLKIRPPLCFSAENVMFFIDTLHAILSSKTNHPSE